MSYKPTSASLPFQKNLSNSNKAGFQQKPKDRLCVVESYDLANKTIKAKQLSTGRIFEAIIDPSRPSTSNRPAADGWNGNVIDERMAKKLEPGSIVVLEGCKVLKRNRTTEVSQATCNWIATPPDPSAEKAFEANYSVSIYDDRIVSVQVWDKKAIDPSSDTGEEEIIKLGQEMDEVCKLHADKKYPVNLGVQFRAKVPQRDASGAVVGYTIVNSSPPFDWIKPERDANNNVIPDKGNHPMTSDHLNDYLLGYMDYVLGSEDQSAPDAEPGLVKAGLLPAGTDLLVEVMKYKAYTGAPLSNHLAIKSEKSPLYRLGNHATKYEIGEDKAFIGKNWVVDGIVFLTSDSAPKKRGEDFEARNMVSRLFANGYSANLHTMVETSDGFKPQVDPGLVVVQDNQTAEARHEGAPASSGLVFSSDKVVSDAATSDPFGDEDDSDSNGFDFGAQIASASAEAPAAPAASQESPAKPADAEKSAAPAKNRFTRGKT